MASIITIAGEKLFAAKAQANEQLDIDTFIFANVPGQDVTDPINREEGLPTEHIVDQQIVQQVGRINDNVVVYSTVLDSITGPYEFNWVGLYSSINDTLVAINHIPTTPKTATAAGIAGNTLNRNFGIEYSGIAELTGINVAPETWQLDFSSRLSGIDKLNQQLAREINGNNWFIDNGFEVYARQTENSFGVKVGVGYVSGLRVELLDEILLLADSYPKNVYIDSWFDGNASSVWKPRENIIITDEERSGYVDESGATHAVLKIAVIHSANNVEDLREEKKVADKVWTVQNFISIVKNVEQLKNTIGIINGQQVELLGYFNEGDGGGGSLIWFDNYPEDDNDANIFSASGSAGKWVRRESELEPKQAGWESNKNGARRLAECIQKGVKFKKPVPLTSLQGQAARWAAGEKSAICFYGDSTTDGRITTIDGETLVTQWNIRHLVGNAVPDGIVFDHDESEVPNAYPSILQRMLREFSNNDSIRVYNAGFRGKQAQDGWAVDNVHNAVFGNANYADTEWMGIMFGLNDSNANVSTQELERNTYIENQALIIDAYARGVQPAIMSCPPTDNTAQTGDYGNNNEVNELIDQVKRRLCAEFKIEFIDINKAIKDWVYGNGDKVSFGSASSDGLHLNDLGHLKKAEYLFKVAQGDNMPTLYKDRHCFDVIHSAMRYALSRDDISSGDTLRGANKLYHNGILTESKVSGVAGKNIVDLWVWNESRDQSLIYRAYKNQHMQFHIANRLDLPQLVLESQLFTSNEFHKKTIFNAVAPECIGTTYGGRSDFPCFVGRLNYGLNRIRLHIPGDFINVFDQALTTYYAIGWFDFISERAENLKPVMHYDYGFNVLDRAVWRDVFDTRGPVIHSTINGVQQNFVRNIVSPSLKGLNSYSLKQPGDCVEWRFKANFVSGSGITLSWNKVDDYSANYPTGVDKNEIFASGGWFIFYVTPSEPETVRFAFLNKENDLRPTAPLIETNVTPSEIRDKTIYVRLRLNTDYTLRLSIWNDGYEMIDSHTIIDQGVIGELVSGYSGGSFLDWQNASETFELEFMQLREFNE